VSQLQAFPEYLVYAWYTYTYVLYIYIIYII
jgi:hypothetical protein